MAASKPKVNNQERHTKRRRPTEIPEKYKRLNEEINKLTNDANNGDSEAFKLLSTLAEFLRMHVVCIGSQKNAAAPPRSTSTWHRHKRGR